MKKVISIFLLSFVAAASMAQVRVATPNNELVLKAEKESDLKILYYGSKLSDADLAAKLDAKRANDAAAVLAKDAAVMEKL